MEREKDKEQERARGGGTVKKNRKDNEGRRSLGRGRLWVRWEQFLQRKRGGCRTRGSRADGDRGRLWKCSLGVWEGVCQWRLSTPGSGRVLSARICSDGRGL